MDRTSLTALVAALGLAAGTTAAWAECHEPREFDTESAAADDTESAAADDDDVAAVEAIGDVALAPGVEDQRGDSGDAAAAATAEAEGEVATAEDDGEVATADDDAVATAEGEGDDFRSEDERELDIEDSAILPSAEDHVESRAPTMDIDCEEHPELCAGDPILTEAEGPALSEPADPANTEPEEAAGARVVAQPDC